ncbi:11882_t:CDS:2, partial [Funneliformis geosporum]
MTTGTLTTSTALKNAIIESFDDCIKDYKNWGLEHTLQYLEDSNINFDEKDYPFIKRQVIDKAVEVFNNPYTTKTITNKAKSLIKNLRNSSKMSTKAAEIFQRQKNKTEQNVRKIETTISSVHVREVKRHAETSKQAIRINFIRTPNISSRRGNERAGNFPEIDNDDSDNDEDKSDNVLLQSESEVSNDKNSAQIFKLFLLCGYPQIITTATASTTTATEEADEAGVNNRQVSVISVEVDSQFQEFQETYFAMRNDMKWKLPSDSYVEDIIFNYAKDRPYECLSHSFILDTENENIMNLFNKSDKEYIKTYNVIADPELEDDLIEYLLTYNETDLSKMREKINAGIGITPYDPKKNFDYQYIYQVFVSLLPRYELRSTDFTRAHLEGWFNSNLWITTEFIRGEGCSRASSERKNRGRESTETRAKIGRKCDGILRELASIEEYAVSEEGNLCVGKSGTKYLTDCGLKMPKVMKDMIKQKINKHGIDFVKSQHFEIVGFLHSGNKCFLLYNSIYLSNNTVPSLLEIEDLIFLIHKVLVAK